MSSARYRVLVVSNLYPPESVGGYEEMCAVFVDHLAARGYEVRVLTSDWRRADSAADEPASRDVRRVLRWYRDGPHQPGTMTPTQRFRVERHNRRVLLRELSDLRPDAVAWWNMGGMSLSQLEYVRRRGVPGMAVVSDYWPAKAMQSDLWMRATRRIGIARRLITAVTRLPTDPEWRVIRHWVYPSGHMRRALEGVGHVNSAKSVVSPGIEFEKFSRWEPDRKRGRALLVVGRLSPEKGVEVALRVLARLPDHTLDLVGPGEPDYRRYLDRLGHELGVVNRVTFRPPVSRAEIFSLYAEYDALLFPTRWEEPWGLVPLEAMASGLPVVASPRGGGREYLRDGENCLIADDEEAFVRAVTRLDEDADLSSRLHEGGLATARENSQSRMNDALERVLLGIVARRST